MLFSALRVPLRRLDDAAEFAAASGAGGGRVGNTGLRRRVESGELNFLELACR
jgi:hypothetical protein